MEKIPDHSRHTHATPHTDPNAIRTLYALVLVQQTIASFTHIVARGAATSGNPLLIVLIRGVLSITIFFVWIRLQKQTFPTIDRRDVPMFLLLGLLNIPGNQMLFVLGLKYTIPPNAALAYALTPAFVLVISAVLYRHAPSAAKFVGIAIAFVGVMIVLLEKDLDLQSSYLLGNGIELSAAFAWALYSVLGRDLTKKYGAIPCVTVTMLTGMLIYAPLYGGLAAFDVVPALTRETFSAITPLLWLQIAYLALFATCISFFLWFYVMGKLEASSVAVFSNLQPVLTTLITIAIFGTVPTLVFVLGGVLVLVGVVITQRA